MNSNSISQVKPVITAADLPRIFGTQDARHGASFAPEMYFTHKSDKREYALGFASVAGDSIETLQFTGNTLGERN
jgi:hypothetical protein